MKALASNHELGLEGQPHLYDYFSRGGKKRRKIKKIIRKKRKAPVTPAPVEVPSSETSPGQATEPALPPSAPVNTNADSMPTPSTTEEQIGSEGEGVEESEYWRYNDNFLGKNREKQRQENRAIRLERRNLKNEDRKASVERMQAETQMLKQMGGAPADAKTGSDDASKNDNDKDKDTTKSKTLYIILGVVGVVVAGSILWMVTSHNRAMSQAA